jgi:hypothetical protein
MQLIARNRLNTRRMGLDQFYCNADEADHRLAEM